MAAAWPFPNHEAMLNTSDAIWSELDTHDWLEAFQAHPRIGERTAEIWSQHEQSGAASAVADQLNELERLNRAYEDRFGYIFIICASGKTAEQILEALRDRLNNAHDFEIRIAAEQQRQITRLRLMRYFGISA